MPQLATAVQLLERCPWVSNCYLKVTKPKYDAFDVVDAVVLVNPALILVHLNTDDALHRVRYVRMEATLQCGCHKRRKVVGSFEDIRVGEV
jgi:hypothetical protein